MVKNLKLTIHGDVQGVGFRDEAYWTARKLHVAGFIMNESDGTVYIEAEGETSALDEFLAWCRRGPITAKITKVEVAWSPARGKFTGFTIG